MPKTAEHLREQPLRRVFLHLGHCSCRHNTCCCDISGGWDGLRLQGCASTGTRSANSETYIMKMRYLRMSESQSYVWVTQTFRNCFIQYRRCASVHACCMTRTRQIPTNSPKSRTEAWPQDASASSVRLIKIIWIYESRVTHEGNVFV